MIAADMRGELSARWGPAQARDMRRANLASTMIAAAFAAWGASPTLARAEEPRTIDFQGGIAYHQALLDGFTPMPALGLELRAYSPHGLWLAGAASWEPSVDLRNPEHGEVANLFAFGGGAGVWLHMGASLMLYGGARAEWAHQGDVDGLRLGPSSSLALLVGHAWGHPMALEAKLSWLGYVMTDGTRPGSWQGGLYLSGTLFPNRPMQPF
jgi:hypothetical protein